MSEIKTAEQQLSSWLKTHEENAMHYLSQLECNQHQRRAEQRRTKMVVN
jgi:hypothetical protein